MSSSGLGKLNTRPGYYVVAVSGGVDSVVLLHLLQQAQLKVESRKLKDGDGVWRLVVAHYDHGIRADSAEDRLFVQELARSYSLPFVYDCGKLGPDCSEAKAREYRYKFLNKVRAAAGADAVVTAHHNDDLLETAIINMLRGTGPKGLAALKSTKTLIRPLLGVTKPEIVDYAKTHGLAWREDDTNKDEKYLRNYVRRNILTKFSAEDRRQLQTHIDNVAGINPVINEAVEDLLGQHLKDNTIGRMWFVGLPHDVAKKIIVRWLEIAGASYDKKRVDRLVIAAKTLSEGKIVDIDNRYKMTINQSNLALIEAER
jgi:tRNA(Ile)-lysidine synthetase-like protein